MGNFLRTDLLIAERQDVPFRGLDHNDGKIQPTSLDTALRLQPSWFTEANRETLDEDRIKRSLSQVAHYIDLRQPSLNVGYTFGLVDARMAHIAVNRFGFQPIPISLDQLTREEARSLGNTIDGDPNLVVMGVHEFVEKFKEGKPDGVVQVNANMDNAQDARDDAARRELVKNRELFS